MLRQGLMVGNRFTFTNNEDEVTTKDAPLDETDKVWQRLKYEHIKDVSEKLRRGLDEFKGKYESVARIDRKEKNTSLIEMNRAVKNVTAYNLEKAQVRLIRCSRQRKAQWAPSSRYTCVW